MIQRQHVILLEPDLVSTLILIKIVIFDLH